MKLQLARLAALLAWALAAAWLAWPAQYLRFNNDHWLTPDHPVSRDLERLEQEFETAEGLLVVLRLRQPYFASQATRRRVAELEDALGGLPSVAKTTSVATAQALIPLGDDNLRIASYRQMREEDGLTLDAWRADFLRGPYARRLLSQDGRITALHLELDPPPALLDESDPEQKAIARAEFRRAALGQIQAQLHQSGWAGQAHAVGDASLKAELDRILSQDLVRLLGLGLLVATLGLWASTRSLRRALFVSLTCGACAATGLGMMQRLGAPFTATSLVLPLLVLVVTVADALHVLARWDWERGRTGDARQAWRNTLRKTYAPCLVASLTTAAGCLSFAITPLLALRDFAWDASLAILVAYPLLLAPLWAAMLGWPALLGGPLPKTGQQAGEKAGQEAENGAGQGAGHKPAALLQPQRWTPRLRLRRWLALWGGATLLFAAALPFARSESDFLQVFFAPHSDTRQGFDLVDRHLGGSGVLDVIIDSGQEEHFRGLQGRDAVLAFETRLRQGLQDRDWLRDINSYLTPLRVAHRGLEGEGPRAQDDATLAQELFFLDLSQSESDRGVLQPWLTFDGASTRVRLITPNLNSQQLQQLQERVGLAAAPMQDQGHSAAITGPANYVRYLSSLVFQSQGRAGALAIALIGALVLLQLGLRWGGIALAVNLPPLLITLGTIVWLGLPFDFGTILVTSLTLGLVVDSSLHLFSCARRLSASGQPLQEAFGEALRETLPPILRATAVITAGLAVLWTSELVLIQRFAALSILGVWLGCLSAVTLPLCLLPRARPSGE